MGFVNQRGQEGYKKDKRSIKECRRAKVEEKAVIVESNMISKAKTYKLSVRKAFASLLVIVLPCSVVVADVVIRLNDRAVVKDRFVRLSDIATISGDEDIVKSLSDFVVADAEAKDEITIRAYKLAYILSQAGFNPLDVMLTGSAVCSVKIVIEPDIKEKLFREGEKKATLRLEIENHITELVKDRLKVDYKLDLKFNENIEDLLTLTSPPYIFGVEPTDKIEGKFWGLMAFKVSIFERGEIIKIVPVLVKVQIKAKVLVAKKKINSKADIMPELVDIVWKDVSEVQNLDFVRLDELKGLRAKRVIPEGTILTHDLLEPKPLVLRGQLVTVIYNKAGLEIRMVGKALKTGTLNELIPVRNEKSKKIFFAKVIDAGKVQLGEEYESIIAARE